MAGSAFSKPFGSVRQSSPAFQREWASLQSSAVEITGLAKDSTQALTLAPSSTGVSGTIFIWGFALVAGVNTVAPGFVVDDDGKKLLGAIAHQEGPFFIAYDTPIKVTQNSKVLFMGQVVQQPNPTYATLYYTVMTEEDNT